MIGKEFEVTNRLGLHARPSTLFVQRAQKYAAEIKVKKENQQEEIDGKSILGLLTLGAEQGSKVFVVVNGQDEERLIEEIAELFSNKFYED